MSYESLFYACLVLFWLKVAIEAYASHRQIRFLRASLRLPPELAGVLTQRAFERKRLLSLGRLLLDRAKHVSQHALYTCVVMYLPRLWAAAGAVVEGLNDEAAQSAVLCAGLVFLHSLVCLPFAAYHNFVLSKKHSLVRKAPERFIYEQVARLVLLQAAGSVFATCVVHADRAGGDLGFVYLWLLATAASVAAGSVLPAIVAPSLGLFTPLPEGTDLTTQLEELAESVGFPPDDLFAVGEGLTQSLLALGGACSFGCGCAKGIAMFGSFLHNDDVPFDDIDWFEDDEEQSNSSEDESIGFSIPEVLAIISHELGHWKLNHTAKRMALVAVGTFLMFGTLAAMRTNQALHSAFGFASERPPAIASLLIATYATAMLSLPVGLAWKRFGWRQESAADAFAVRLGHGRDLASALLKYADAFPFCPVFDSVYAVFSQTHPPLIQRVAAIAAQNEGNQD